MNTEKHLEKLDKQVADIERGLEASFKNIAEEFAEIVKMLGDLDRKHETTIKAFKQASEIDGELQTQINRVEKQLATKD